MKNYEALIILDMKGNESSVEELTQNIAKEMTALGAQISKTTDQGRREFVYESNHKKAGHYVVYTFSAAPEAIRTIREHLSINPVIHLQYYKAIA